MDIYNFYRQGLQNPKTRVIFIIGTLLYLLSPIDLIPDFIPIFGQIDDLGLLLVFGFEMFKILSSKTPKKKDAIDAEFTSKNE